MVEAENEGSNQDQKSHGQAQKEGGRRLASDGTELGSITCDELSSKFGQVSPNFLFYELNFAENDFSPSRIHSFPFSLEQWLGWMMTAWGESLSNTNGWFHNKFRCPWLCVLIKWDGSEDTVETLTEMWHVLILVPNSSFTVWQCPSLVS